MLGLIALIGLAFGTYYLIRIAVHRMVSVTVTTIQRADSNSKDAQVAELKKQLDLQKQKAQSTAPPAME
jgi:hypothetical protein